MAAAYIDATYIHAFISQGRLEDLFTDPGGSYTASYLTQQISASSELIKSAAKNAGYTLGDTTTDENVKLATFGQLLMMAYGRKGEAVPEQFATAVNLAAAIRSGDWPLTSTPNARDAVGGVKFSETTSTVSGSRHPVFNRIKLDVY